MAESLAKKTGARLHVFHISTAKELALFENIPLKEKNITSEVCIHHLNFSEEDYINFGSKIKWNPSIKTKNDQNELWKALNTNLIDVIATDHAPHTFDEKQNNYQKCPSGGPLVQHSLVSMLEGYHQQKISLETIVKKMCHNPSILFDVKNRGYISEGYYADLVVFNLNKPWTVTKENLLYKCKWSPFNGFKFKGAPTHTIITGKIKLQAGKILGDPDGTPLQFS